jgi:hypothetical protein
VDGCPEPASLEPQQVECVAADLDCPCVLQPLCSGVDGIRPLPRGDDADDLPIVVID